MRTVSVRWTLTKEIPTRPTATETARQQELLRWWCHFQLRKPRQHIQEDTNWWAYCERLELCPRKTLKNITKLDIQKNGAMIAGKLLEVTKEFDVPEENMHCCTGSLCSRYPKKHNHPVRHTITLDLSNLVTTAASILVGWP